jgi:hypothetical protein
MSRLLDPDHTIAIILGSHDWSRAGLGSARSFRGSAVQYHRYLTKTLPQGLGLEPDAILNFFDDPFPAGSQLMRMGETLGSLVRERRESQFAVRDVLIYYVGHGSCEAGGHLHLLVKDSLRGYEEQSSISTLDLAKTLRVSAPQQRRIAILDCCFSEAAVEAFGAMGTLDEAVAVTAMRDLSRETTSAERGTVLLCSSPRQRPSIGFPNADRTLFTGALLDVLKEGFPLFPSEALSFADVRDAVYDRMLVEHSTDAPRPALHQPDQQAGDLLRVPAFPNSAATIWVKQKESESLDLPQTRQPGKKPEVLAQLASTIDEVAPTKNAEARWPSSNKNPTQEEQSPKALDPAPINNVPQNTFPNPTLAASDSARETSRTAVPHFNVPLPKYEIGARSVWNPPLSTERATPWKPPPSIKEEIPPKETQIVVPQKRTPMRTLAEYFIFLSWGLIFLIGGTIGADMLASSTQTSDVKALVTTIISTALGLLVRRMISTGGNHRWVPVVLSLLFLLGYRIGVGSDKFSDLYGFAVVVVLVLCIVSLFPPADKLI